MGKKNLSSLMEGLMGGDSNLQQLVDNAASEPENTPAEEPTAATEDAKPALPPKRGKGRPKKAESTNDVHATFVVNSTLLKKIKYISLMDEKPQKEIIGAALSKTVADWERRNGPIPIQ